MEQDGVGMTLILLQSQQDVESTVRQEFLNQISEIKCMTYLRSKNAHEYVQK